MWFFDYGRLAEETFLDKAQLIIKKVDDFIRFQNTIK
jgi:hypothetical protein